MNGCEEHSNVLRRIKVMFVICGCLEEDLTVKCYIDTSFQTNRDDYTWQSGYVFIINEDAILWKTSKKIVISHSTIKLEYIVSLEATNEGIWMKKFIEDLGIAPSI